MIYCFDEIELDCDNFKLIRDGETHSLEPQVFDLLVYLIRHRERMVSRQELFDNLWRGKVVSDATLSNHIKMARAALGDDGEQQKMIQTVRGRGYQFVATVEERTEERIKEEAQPPEQVSSKLKKGKPRGLPPILIYFAFATAIFAGIVWLAVSRQQVQAPVAEFVHSSPSIAILPFENRSNLSKDEYFTEGVHHDLLMQVAKIKNIKTISRTSVNLYRDMPKSIPQIAKELGVAVVLEGGVQRSGDQIRMNVQLIDGATDELLWAESYTRALTVQNVFEIQSDIANAIAKSLSTVLSPSEIHAIAQSPTNDLNALDAYFLAGAAMRKNNNEGFQKAIEYLHQALELDPNFAQVYAVLAQLYLDQIYWSGEPVAKQLSLASPLIQQALALNPELSEAHSALASLHEHQGSFEAAYQSYQQALRYRPNNEKVYAALGRFHLWVRRDIPASIEQFNHALQINPKDNLLKENLTEALIRAGRFENARTLIHEMQRNDPKFASPYRALADLEAWQNKNLSTAQKQLRLAIALDPNVPSYTLKLALRFLDLGEKDLALRWLKHTLDLAPNNHSATFAKGLVFELEGQYKEALKAFNQVPPHSPVLNQSLHHVLDIGLRLNQHSDIENSFRRAHPELFNQDAEVNARNYVSAYMLARFLLVRDQKAQADFLLQKSLEFAKQKPIGDWQGRHRDWLTQIYLAMDAKPMAVQSFESWVEEGYYSAQIGNNPAYQKLSNDPAFQAALKTMNKNLRLNKKSFSEDFYSREAYWLP